MGSATLSTHSVDKKYIGSIQIHSLNSILSKRSSSLTKQLWASFIWVAYCIKFLYDYYCQVFYSYVRSSNYALLDIAELPNNELTSIHTLSLPPLLL